MLTMPDDQFDELVADGLDAVPTPLMDMLDNVVFLVEDEPEDGTELLGVYEGVPLTARTEPWGPAQLPDRITIFRGPTLRMCDTRDQVRDEVAITVVHEIAHHFGIDDAHLHDLGWG